MPPPCGRTEDIPILTAHEVFRIHRKMFAMLMFDRRVSEHPIVNLKADPDELPLPPWYRSGAGHRGGA